MYCTVVLPIGAHIFEKDDVHWNLMLFSVVVHLKHFYDKQEACTVQADCGLLTNGDFVFLCNSRSRI